MGLSSGWTPLPDKLDALGFVFERMAAGEVTVRHEVRPLDEVSSVWQLQKSFPHTKLVISLR